MTGRPESPCLAYAYVCNSTIQVNFKIGVVDKIILHASNSCCFWTLMYSNIYSIASIYPSISFDKDIAKMI